MKINSLYSILLFFLLSCGNTNEKVKTEITIGNERLTINKLQYDNFFLDRLSMLDSISLDSFRVMQDTLEYYLKDEEHSYASDITIIQQYQYLFQDLWTVKNEVKWIKIFYTYPRRKDSNELLMIKNSVNEIATDLERFSGYLYKDLLNELYLIDSEYVYVDIIDNLGLYLTLAESDIYNTEPSFFGVNVNDYFQALLYEKKVDFPVSYSEIFETAIEKMKNDKVVSLGVSEELNNFLQKVDSTMIDYFREN